MKKILLVAASLLLGGCLGMPAEITPVTGFELPRYLGTWYEIARLDHSFERGLEQVTANYTMREDGGVRVLNRGYDPARQAWEDAEGKAFFVEDPATGYLKVSFFGPFYGSYVIFELDREDYQYAFISGPNHDYLWLLSRTPTVDDSLVEHFKQRAVMLGFSLDDLVIVNQ